MSNQVKQSEKNILQANVRVLAADDNRTNRLVLNKMMQKIGGAVDFVENGQDALDAYKSEPYDLLLFDISMPIMDGTTALEKIRKFETESGAEPAPAIAVTANTLAEQVANYFSIGFDDCLPKPVKRDGLAKSIEKVMKNDVG